MNNFHLAGDIGGTKTRLALVRVEGSQVETLHESEYSSGEFGTFEELLQCFLSTAEKPLSAALGIAGPVQGRKVKTTNLPWLIDADSLQTSLGFPCVLLNDLEATAAGILALKDDELLTLQEGAPGAQGNVAVIAAGTGLGEAGLYWDGKRHRPYATEGGHTSFSPSDELEMTFFLFLQREFGHVSWERVVSGMGLVSLYRFLCLHHKATPPAWLVESMQQGTAAAISAAALAEEDDICVETLRRFIRFYGAEAGNLALKTMSRGGVYLGGGIAPKILSQLQQGGFIEAFLDKGRMRPLLEMMPVKVILNDRTALLGAALYAAESEFAKA